MIGHHRCLLLAIYATGVYKARSSIAITIFTFLVAQI